MPTPVEAETMTLLSMLHALPGLDHGHGHGHEVVHEFRDQKPETGLACHDPAPPQAP